MTEQQPNGPVPDDNRTSDQPSLDDRLGALSDDDRKAVRDYLAGLRDQAARYRRRVGELEPKASAFDEQVEAAKTAEQKAADRLARLEKERDEAKATLLRYDVAASFPGLQASDAAFLTGATRPELEASAERLIARIQAAGQPPAARQPVPDPGQGRDTANGGADPETWLRQALRHR